jgi:hypothetical protein
MFAKLTAPFHGGRRSRKASRKDRKASRKDRKASRKDRKASRKDRKNRKASRRLATRRLATRKDRKSRRSSRRQMGGAGADYPNEFSVTLPSDMHAAARISSLDTAFAQLPEFVGKYGNQTGGSRRSRRSGCMMRGGMAPVEAPAMILSPQEEHAAFLNPQWYTENQVIPSFVGPSNAYAQKAGRRRRNSRKASRKMNRKHRK